MSGKLPITTNKYASLDIAVSNAEGVTQSPFLLTRLLDIIRNDGAGEAVITLDGGPEITLAAGDYVGPWPDYHCSTITITCTEAGKSCRIRALGV